jgi:hypothetical protein
MAFWKKKTEESRGEKINRWVAELQRVAAGGRDEGLHQVDVLTALAIALGRETASTIHVEYSGSSVDTLLDTMFEGARKAAYDATRQLTGSLPKHNENPDGLSDEQFKALVQRILDTATRGTTTGDSVAATAKALGTQIAVLSRRPDTPLDQLIQTSLQSVAAFAYEGRAYLEANSTPAPVKPTR